MHTHTRLPCSASEVDRFLSRPSQALQAALQRLPGDFMVLGAAGKMGLHVCLMLRQALDAVGDKRRVIAVSRFSQPAAIEEFASHGIQTLRCDLAERDQLRALDEVENIIFMAGAKFGTAGRPELLELMNVEVPRRVAEKFRHSRITAFSTGCVYSYYPVDSSGPTEEQETAPVGAYAQSCLGREQAFLEGARRHGTPVSLIRLNYAVEFRYGVPVDLAVKLRAGDPIDVTMGHANIIWQRDAIIHSLLAHELASSDGFILNVTRPEVLRIRDMATRLGELLDCEPRFTGSEAPTAWISNSSKAVRLFGEPETHVDTILQYVAAWQLEQLPILGKPTGFDKRDGNF